MQLKLVTYLSHCLTPYQVPCNFKFTQGQAIKGIFRMFAMHIFNQ